MLTVLYIAGIIAAFIFPAALVTAIRSPDTITSDKNMIKACITFGIIVIAILTLAAY